MHEESAALPTQFQKGCQTNASHRHLLVCVLVTPTEHHHLLTQSEKIVLPTYSITHIMIR